MKTWGIFITSLIWLGLSLSASAHTRSQSFSNWEIRGADAQFTFAVDARRLTQLGSLYPETQNLSELMSLHVRETLNVTQDGKACTPHMGLPSGTPQGVYRLNGYFACPDNITDTAATINVASFFKVSPTHIHLARITGGGDHVLREGYASFSLHPDHVPTRLSGFISVGFHHVLSGADHLLFLVVLALAARGIRQAALCITGFTVGHMLVLGLVTYGYMHPDGRWVEALIGFTIAVMALEAANRYGLARRKSLLAFAALGFLVMMIPVSGSMWFIAILIAIYTLATALMSAPFAQRMLPLITVAFGCVHGAGFSGGLQELSLSRAEIFRPLLGFNIGVELAQLMALALIYIGLWVMARLSTSFRWRVEYASLLVSFGLGCFWFAERLWA